MQHFENAPDYIDQSQDAIGGLWTGSHPPLTIWMMALSCKILGVSELSVRLPIALCGTIIVLSLYRFVLLLWNRRTIALSSSLILLGTSYFTKYTRMSQLDVPVIMWIFLSLYFFWKGVRGKYANFYVAGVFFGFALMSKIIVGVVSPMIGAFFIGWEYVRGNRKDGIRNLSGIFIISFLGAMIMLPGWSQCMPDLGIAIGKIRLAITYFQGSQLP